MSDDFLDSNIVLYVFDRDDLRKRNLAIDLLAEGLRSTRTCISFQVVQEALNVLTRRLDHPLTPDRAQRFLDSVLSPLWQVMPSEQLYGRALGINERYKYGFYDSLIIAAALEAGCTRLLSEDMQDGQRIETLTIVNPFATA